MTPAERTAALAALLDGTGIALLELTTPEGTIRLRRGAGPAAAEPAPAPAPARATQAVTVPSPCPGMFRPAHPSLDRPLAAPGQTVAAGEAVGLVQVGALLLHVHAPVAGIVQAVLATDGALVGFGTPLLQLTETLG